MDSKLTPDMMNHWIEKWKFECSLQHNCFCCDVKDNCKNAHSKIKEVLKYEWKCPECGKVFTDFKEAEKHINDCIAWHDEKRYQDGQ